jgi:hypothetical protein
MIYVFKKIVLLDWTSGIYSERIEIDGQRMIEQQDFPDADQIAIFERFNNSKQHSFTATRVHRDEDTAQLFVHTHDEDVLGKGPLLVRGSFKSWERFYNVAACTHCKSYAEGCRSWSSYELITGLSSKTR